MLLCCQSHLGCPSMSARQHHHLPPATQQCTHYFPVTTNEHIFHIMFWLVNCSINFDQSPHLLTQTTTPVALWQFLWRFWVTKIRFILCIKVNKQASTRISKEQLKREVGCASVPLPGKNVFSDCLNSCMTSSTDCPRSRFFQNQWQPCWTSNLGGLCKIFLKLCHTSEVALTHPGHGSNHSSIVNQRCGSIVNSFVRWWLHIARLTVVTLTSPDTTASVQFQHVIS